MHALVAMPYSHARNVERPAYVARLDQARSSVSSTGSARMTAFCEATIAIDTPVPATISGGTSSQYATLASATHAIHANPPPA
jgi:hypothetical protein